MPRKKRKDFVIIRIPREHFVRAGRLGGLVGGKATAANMTPEERHARAVKAAKTRWRGHKKK